jgi:hypothetical protein
MNNASCYYALKKNASVLGTIPQSPDLEEIFYI